MLGFIRALYESSEFRVRGAVGVDGGSSTIKLNRGLRQGCPLSPILFDIFINDLYGKPDMVRREMGVGIPRVPEEKEGLMAGLLFADDLVAVARSRPDMQTQAANVHHWCIRWEMKVGIKKCGVMCMGAKDDGRVKSGQWQLENCPIYIGREAVPVVEEYTYLGVVVTRDMDLKVMAKGRLKKAEKALAAIRPMLRDQEIPLAMRVLVFKTRVLSSVLYGAEVWGMREDRCKPAQTLVNKGLRLLMGCSETDNRISIGALQKELDVAPIYALAAGRRARAFKKYGSLKTWCKVLFEYPMKDEHSSAWIKQTQTWLNTYYEGEARRINIGAVFLLSI